MGYVARFTPKVLFWLAVAAVLAGAAAGGIYLADRYYYQPLREQQRLVENLHAVLAQLTRQTRIAEVAIVEQGGNPLMTTFRYVEVDERGEPVGGEKRFTIQGDTAHFDAMVITFHDAASFLDRFDLKQQDRETVARQMQDQAALILFRRVYGDKQAPEQAFPLDEPDQVPSVYRTSAVPGSVEKQLWAEFWDLSNNPQLARSRGVTAAYGKGVWQKLVKGNYYVLERTLTGDLRIQTHRLPAVIR